jgi:predicted DCC family thiol-disulfide oxidoreductase YuxK
MKQDKVIIYDDSCPLCTWYTGAFIQAGFLDKDGRQSFCSIEPELLKQIDPDRSRNEIPLVNPETGEVLYGIDALLDILGRRLPFVKTIGNTKGVNWFLKEIYKFVSYNRRVIVAGKANTSAFDCTPDFSFKYRSMFMLFSLLLNTALLFPLQQYVFTKTVFLNTSQVQLQLAHFALVLSNLGIALRLEKRKAFEYLGQITILAVISMLLTVPLIIFNFWYSSPVVNNTVLAVILLFTIKEYFRRMQFAGVPEHHRLIMPLNIFFLTIFLIYLSV